MDFPPLPLGASPRTGSVSGPKIGAWGPRSVTTGEGAQPEVKLTAHDSLGPTHLKDTLFEGALFNPLNQYLNVLKTRYQEAKAKVDKAVDSTSTVDHKTDLDHKIDRLKQELQKIGKAKGFRSPEAVSIKNQIDGLIAQKKDLIAQDKILNEHNFDLKSVDNQFKFVSPASVYEAAKEWLGPNPVPIDYTSSVRQSGQKSRVSAWLSADGERYLRPPILKPNHNLYQANFEILPQKSGGVVRQYAINLHIGVAFGENDNHLLLKSDTNFNWLALNTCF